MNYRYLKGLRSFEYDLTILFDTSLSFMYLCGILSMHIGMLVVNIKELEGSLFTQTFKYSTKIKKLVFTQLRTNNAQVLHLCS